MDDLIPQLDLEDDIRRLSALLDQATRKILKRSLAVAKAESAYKRAFYRAYLQVDGKNTTEREAKAFAMADDNGTPIHELYDARKYSEAILESATEAARNIRSQLSALQTLAANQRYLLDRT